MNEIWIESYDKLKLFIRFWPAQNPKASVLIIHGLGDHSGRYELFAHFLASQGISVYALDLRGHGRSDGKRGHVALPVDFLMDISTTLSKITRQEKTPLFLLGHSMGALFSLSFVCNDNAYGLKGVIVSSSFFSPFEKIPLFTQGLIQLLNVIFPSFCIQRNPIHTTLLSHDPDISKRYLSDPLSHLKISARLYQSIKAVAQHLLSASVECSIPLLMVLAGEDRLVRRDLSEQFFEKVKCSDKLKKVYPYFYHEIFNEVGKEQVWKDVVQWIKQQLNTVSN